MDGSGTPEVPEGSGGSTGFRLDSSNCCLFSRTTAPLTGVTR